MRHYFTLLYLIFAIMACGRNETEEMPIEPEKEVLYSIYGNSISTFKGYIPSDYMCWFTEEQMSVEDTWWYQVGKTMNWRLCNNSSWSGARVSYDADWEYNSYFISPYRINNLSENGNPDYILVLGGVNDWRWSLNELGTFEETDSTFFSGAYRIMLDRLENKYPSSKIICLSILPISEYGSTIYSINSQGWSINDANKMVKRICDSKGIFFINMDQCPFAENVARFTEDGLHPNKEGMKLLADYVSAKLKEYIGGGPTKVRAAFVIKQNRNNEIYNLSGYRVTKLNRGLKISKDRKTISINE